MPYVHEDGQELEMSQVRDDIIELCRMSPGITVHGISDQTGTDISNTRRIVYQATLRGFLRRTGGGTKNDPYKYFVGD